MRDFSFFQDPNLLGYYARTDSTDVSGNQDSYRLRFDYDADLYALQVERLDVGAEFKPEVGFLRRTDFIQNLVQARVQPPAAAVGVGAQGQPRRRVRLHHQPPGSAREPSGEDHVVGPSSTAATRGRRASMTISSSCLARSRSAGLKLPVGGYRYSNVRGTYTLGSQRKISGDLVAGYGGFYGGDRVEASYRGRVELSKHLSTEPGSRSTGSTFRKAARR